MDLHGLRRDEAWHRSPDRNDIWDGRPRSRRSGGHVLRPLRRCERNAYGGVLHAIWWDSRNDPCFSVTRPIGNCADRTTVPSLDVYGATSADAGATWTDQSRISDVTTNPNYEQF